MKCEKCGNEYPSEYYFSAPNICTNCYGNLNEDERQNLNAQLFGKMAGFNNALRVGFGKRLLAFILDLIINNIILGAVFYLTGDFEAIFGALQSIFSDPTAFSAIQEEVMPVILFVSVVYYSLEVFLAATPGKMILGIQIADQYGETASIRALVIRFLLKHISVIFSVVYLFSEMELVNVVGGVANFIILIGCFFVLSQKRQAFHDMAAGTAVFNKNDITEPSNNAIN